MKKFLYLCAMMTLSMNMMAQIDPYDRNWDTIVLDDFNTLGRTWVVESFLSSDDLWRAYPGSGVTHGKQKHVYQFSQCRFNLTDETMELVAEYDVNGRIPQNDYYLPKWMWPSFGGNGYPPSDGLLYFSGEIDYVDYDHQHNTTFKFQYGYFEIRCKLPKHKGAFPAFWLHSASTNTNDPYYEEIDIFEYSWSIGDPNSHSHPYPNPTPTYAGDPNVITTGIYQNLYGDTVVFETDTYARNYPRLPYGGPDISEWHTYSCEWMPDHVYWFLDGRLVNSFYDQTHIPRHSLTLKTNYAINDYYKYNDTIWMGPGMMTIDYIKAFVLDWDCDTDEVITSQSDLQQFPFAVKKSITIAPTNEDVIVRDIDKVTLRATDSFEISDSFEVQQGGEFTVIMQACPE